MPSIDRRSLIAGAALLGAPTRAARLRATAPRTAGADAPLAVGDARPMLAWRVAGPDGTMQVAWHIQVASDPALLAAGRADLWDSGRVADATSAGVRYGGRPLTSRRRCFWQVGRGGRGVGVERGRPPGNDAAG